jgi:hypothetical protein
MAIKAMRGRLAIAGGDKSGDVLSLSIDRRVDKIWSEDEMRRARRWKSFFAPGRRRGRLKSI